MCLLSARMPEGRRQGGARPPLSRFSDLPTSLIVHYTNRGSSTPDLYKMTLHFPTYTFRRPCEVEQYKCMFYLNQNKLSSTSFYGFDTMLWCAP